MNRRDLLRAGVGTGIVALSSGLLLAGCGSGSDQGPATGAATDDGKPIRGGTITVAMVSRGAAETLSPHAAISQNDWHRTKQINETLFRFGAEGTWEPWLAESAEPNADATEWTFRLREGVEWHDGKPLTADDLIYTFNSWRDPDVNFSSFAKSIVDFNRIKRLDDRTVRLGLKRGLAEFHTLTGFYPAAVVQDGFKNWKKPIGTGPFKFESFTPGKQSVFVRNPNYWRDGKPYVDRLVIDSSFSDEAARVNAVLSGAAQIVTAVPPALAKAHANSSRIEISQAPGPAFQSIAMRVDAKPFDDVRVRQALQLLVNREALAQNVFEGFATPGHDIGGFTLSYYADDLKRVQDVEQAKSLLKAAGQTDLRISLKTHSGKAGFVEAGTLIARDFREAGVTMDINRVDPSTYFSKEAGYLSNPFNSQDWTQLQSLSNFYLQTLTTGAPYNVTHWGDDRADALLNEALKEVDETRAADKWREVQKLQFEQGGNLIYNNLAWVDGYSPSLRGIRATKAGWADGVDFASAWIAS